MLRYSEDGKECTRVGRILPAWTRTATDFDTIGKSEANDHGPVDRRAQKSLRRRMGASEAGCHGRR